MSRITYTTYEPSPEADEQIKGRNVLLIDNEAALEVLTIDDCLSAMEEAFIEEGLGAAANRTKAGIYIPTSADPEAWHHYVTMEGGIRKLGVVAIRIRSHIHTPTILFGKKRHIPWAGARGKYGGLILLFSSEDGSLLAILHDGHIQHMRVGATVGIATKHMARQDAQILGILGSGGLATTNAWAIAKVRSLRKIKVYSPNPDHRVQFAQQLSKDLGIEAIALDEPQEVVQGSDIVCASTDATEPVILGSWLEPGMYLTTVTIAEIDDEALRRVDRYVQYRDAPPQHHFTTPEDHRPRVSGSTGEELQRQIALIGGEKNATLPQVLLGEAVGRASDSEITFFSSEGTGVQFTALASMAYRRAKERGLGRELPLSWFLGDIKS